MQVVIGEMTAGGMVNGGAAQTLCSDGPGIEGNVEMPLSFVARACMEIVIAISIERCIVTSHPMHLMFIQRKHATRMAMLMALVFCLAVVGFQEEVKAEAPSEVAVFVTGPSIGSIARSHASLLRRSCPVSNGIVQSVDLFELTEDDEFSKEKLTSSPIRSAAVAGLHEGAREQVPISAVNDCSMRGFEGFQIFPHSVLLLI